MIANNLQYTPFNKVSFITDGDYTFTFQYNSNHERVKMEVENDNETMMTKYYFGPSEIQETSEGTRTINHIGIGTGLLAMHVTNPDGSTEIIQCFTDRLGSPILLANKNGHEIGRYSYTPWGKQRDPYTLQTIGFSNQPVSWFHRGYTGHEMLYGIGIINMNGRIYDPHTHQFLSPDNYIQAPGFSQSFNRFAYCVNNPLIYTDPDGEVWHIVIGAAIGAGISITTQVLTNMASGDSFGEAFRNVDWVDVGVSAAVGALTCGIGNGGTAVLNTAKVGVQAGLIVAPAAVSASFDLTINKGFEVVGKHKPVEEAIWDFGISAVSNAMVIKVFSMPTSEISKLSNNAKVHAFLIEKTFELIPNFAIPLFKNELYTEPEYPNNNGNSNDNNQLNNNQKYNYNE